MRSNIRISNLRQLTYIEKGVFPVFDSLKCVCTDLYEYNGGISGKGMGVSLVAGAVSSLFARPVAAFYLHSNLVLYVWRLLYALV